MRVLFIFYDRSNYLSGPIVNARRVLPELVKRNIETHCILFVLEGSAHSVKYLSAKGVVCHLKKFGKYTEPRISWILKKVAEIKPDIFIPNLSVAGYFASRWIRESGIPTIACHRSDDAFHWSMVDEFVIGKKEWAVSGLVCVSKKIYRDTLQYKPRFTTVRSIPSGVPISRQTSRQEGPLKLLYIGRLVRHQKRILELVDSLSMVIKKHKGITATLIGDGPERDTVEKRIQYHMLTKKIQLYGTVPPEDIQALIAQHDTIVLMSDYEGTPGALMDGMSAGLVPVCLDIPGGVRELVIHGETGLLVDGRGLPFANAITRLSVEQNFRRRLSENAKRHIASNYSLKIAVNKWEELFKDLIADAGQRIPLRIPWKYNLPSPRKGIDREDRRMQPFAGNLARTVKNGIDKLFVRK